MMTIGKRHVDFGTAEALAFASLVGRGVPVRLSGQDSRRGTFNHRHAARVDVETEQQYVPLAHIAPDQARCDIYNSTLSEAGGRRGQHPGLPTFDRRAVFSSSTAGVSAVCSTAQP